MVYKVACGWKASSSSSTRIDFLLLKLENFYVVRLKSYRMFGDYVYRSRRRYAMAENVVEVGSCPELPSSYLSNHFLASRRVSSECPLAHTKIAVIMTSRISVDPYRGAFTYNKVNK